MQSLREIQNEKLYQVKINKHKRYSETKRSNMNNIERVREEQTVCTKRTMIARAARITFVSNTQCVMTNMY